MKVTRERGRQGDVVLKRIGDADPNLSYGPTPEGGFLVMRGSHADHHLRATEFAQGAEVEGNKTFHLRKKAVLEHDDVSKERHESNELVSGHWAYWRKRELGPDNIVQEVMD